MKKITKREVMRLRERLSELDRSASLIREQGGLLDEAIAAEMGRVQTELALAERTLRGGK